MQMHQKESIMQDNERTKLVNALWRARQRLDNAETDGEFEACRQIEIEARAALEMHDWNHPRRAA